VNTHELIAWERGKPRIRYVKGVRRTEIVYPVVCPNCGKERWLKKYDALKAARNMTLCYHCAQTEKARLGWLATSAKWGVKVAVKHQRNYRLAHPSNLEREVMIILDTLGLSYEREVWCECDERVYLIDFVIAGRFAVEVNGDYAHRNRHEADRRKVAALERCGYLVLTLTEADITSGQASHLIQTHLSQI
jgi:hypothetical protein